MSCRRGAGVESLTSVQRLYVEISVLPNDAGLVGYITIGLKAADGRQVAAAKLRAPRIRTGRAGSCAPRTASSWPNYAIGKIESGASQEPNVRLPVVI